MLRSVAKKVLPYSVIENGRRAVFFGTAHRCYVCGAQLRKLLPQGYGYPVLERLQVVGGMQKDNDRCPVCHSCDRERLVKFFFETQIFGDGRYAELGRRRPLRMLHLAPEKGLTKYFRSVSGLEYRAGDLEPQRYRHHDRVQRLDILELPFGDGEIDLLVCNHVLEHIPDDAAAMREIRRVLAPGGLAVLQVPLSLKLPHAREGSGAPEGPEERIARYGQHDHVRIYTPTDYGERLRGAGLQVEAFDAFEADEAAATRLRLNPFEPLFAGRPAGRP
jgi:SAM-dependent methyltransferase